MYACVVLDMKAQSPLAHMEITCEKLLTRGTNSLVFLVKGFVSAKRRVGAAHIKSARLKFMFILKKKKIYLSV